MLGIIIEGAVRLVVSVIIVKFQTPILPELEEHIQP
jgi:hypothetical protein